MLDFKKIEKKWQKRWEKAKLFEADIDKKRTKFFITFPYPYMNGAPHIGHSYSSTRTDVYARFKRMQGFNVLYPQGFHATGEPILGIVERLKKNDMVQIETLREYGLTEKEIEKFKKDPKYVVYWFVRRWTEDFKNNGMSIDWRRSFVTTILTPTYSRFIEWQYNTLRKKGYIVQGTHPVVWCPNDQSPTGDHDRLEGEGESPVEYVLIKFVLGDSFLPAATLRPETVYGVTNIWLNPHADYVKIEVGNEKWVVSKESVIKIKDQFKNVKEIREYDERIDLFGLRVKNPVTNIEVPILPSGFVDPGNATGVVMGVPAHAPYDYVALEEFKSSGETERFGIEKEELEPVSLVISELGEMPAKSVCEDMNITSTKQEKELDNATNIVYKKEFHTGILNEKCGPYQGGRVSEAKDKIVMDFIEKGVSNIFFDVQNVVCRCTTKCHVKILENQWFLKYSDEKWKEKVRKCLGKMNIYPEEAKNNFLATVKWMRDKACTRKSGLGTPLPWDNKWIVETLSDSTIYMAYYTIAGVIIKYKIPANKLADEVFDYIFLSKGDPKSVAKNSKLDIRLIKMMKNEFEYFYPVDLRNSGKDLLQHHLTFFIYHHTALWPEKYWPKGVSVNGFVNVEGEKMSKSKGNIIPLRNLINAYGADLTRINIATSSEGIDDADWRVENLKSFRQRIELLYSTAKNLKMAKMKESKKIDTYLLSRLNKIVKISAENYEATKFRTVINYALFEAINEIKWYLTRVNGIRNANKKTMENALSIIIRLLAPFTPHICEEMWAISGNKGFVSVADFPAYDPKLNDEDAEESEIFIRQIIDDIREIQRIATIKPKKTTLFIAEDWKFSVYNTVLENKTKTSAEVTRDIMATDLKKYGSATIGFIQNLYKRLNELNPVIEKPQQFAILRDAKIFFEEEIGCPVDIVDAEKSDNKKARAATPQNVGILLD